MSPEICKHDKYIAPFFSSFPLLIAVDEQQTKRNGLCTNCNTGKGVNRRVSGESLQLANEEPKARYGRKRKSQFNYLLNVSSFELFEIPNECDCSTVKEMIV